MDIESISISLSTNKQTVDVTFDKFYLDVDASNNLTAKHKFFKVILLLNLLCKMTVELTFENFYLVVDASDNLTASPKSHSFATIPVCVCTHTHIYIYEYIYRYVCIHMNTCICIYIYAEIT